jgi:regulator of RNase E activity RraB
MAHSKTNKEAKARKIIEALLDAGAAGEAASHIGHEADLKKAERDTDRAIVKAYKFMTGEAPPSDADLVDFIYGEPE